MKCLTNCNILLSVCILCRIVVEQSDPSQSIPRPDVFLDLVLDPLEQVSICRSHFRQGPSQAVLLASPPPSRGQPLDPLREICFFRSGRFYRVYFFQLGIVLPFLSSGGPPRSPEAERDVSFGQGDSIELISLNWDTHYLREHFPVVLLP